jgi:hypothetical protein
MREVVDMAESSHPRWPPGGREWSLADTVVTAEWRCAQLGQDRIDILIQDDGDRLVCVIENKVDAGEGEEQLQRYRGAVESHFGTGRADYRLAFLYLTKEGSRPSDLAWHPVSYVALLEVIEGAMREAEEMGQEVRLFINQYVDAVRRYIMRDSEVQQLCRELSKEHFWLPRWLLNRSVAQDKLSKATQWLRRPARFLDRLLRPRLTIFTSGMARYLIALICILIAVVIPAMELVPFSANGAGAALTAFGLAVSARDGLLALLAFGFTAATAGLVIYHLV